MRLGKKILFILALGLLLRGLVALGVDSALDSLLQTALGDTGLVTETVMSQSTLLQAPLSLSTSGGDFPLYEIRHTDLEEETPSLPPQELAPGDMPIYRATRVERLPSVTFSGEGSSPSPSGIHLRNHTNYSLDIDHLFYRPLPFDPRGGEDIPTVLILHTHGTESFDPDGLDWYENTDNYRTTNMDLNITRVGAEIAAVFEARGIRVIHSRQIHDYPSFRGSYGRSLTAAEAYLARYPEIQVVFDIHRDAILNASGQYVRTLAEVDGVEMAQIMLVVGTDHAGLHHPGWQDNLSFALQLQGAMLAREPSLARPMSLREERFNAHLRPGAVLVEIGSNANTLQEALLAGRVFADLAADVILGS